MRTTAREKYVAGLEDALEQLRDIRRRLENQGGDLKQAVDALNAWKDDVAKHIETYGGRDDAKLFRTTAEFDSGGGISGAAILKGIATYDDLIEGVLRKLPEADVKGGYSEDLRAPLEQLDELSERLLDAYRRSIREDRVDYQTAEEGLRRWREHAYKYLSHIVGEDEAGEIYSMRPAETSWGNPEGSTEEQYEMYVKYLRNLKEEIQKYPNHLVAPFPSVALALNTSQFVHPTRLAELARLKSQSFDLSRLGRLSEELNITWRNGAYHATAMLVRAILDHVPPIFGVSSFAEVASNYAGSKSFKEAMAGLEVAARKIADAHLHTRIRKSETLPTSTQVNCSQQLDVLLAEIVRILK
jgi:hypothetical protein